MEDQSIRLLRFADLKEAQIVTSWPQLRRQIDERNFPPGYLLSPGVRVWEKKDIEAWLAARREAPNVTRNPVKAKA